MLQKEKIGFLGQVSPKIIQNYQINEVVFVAQISLSKIFDYLAKLSPKISYRPISNFPTSEKDLSFIFPEDIDYSKVIQAIKNVGGENLQEASVFDAYRSVEMVKKGQKSMTFHLIFQSFLGTLKNTEIEKIMNAISEKIEKKFAAKLRD
jgi:phenylalanyl-tRNA synthetase beta chain